MLDVVDPAAQTRTGRHTGLRAKMLKRKRTEWNFRLDFSKFPGANKEEDADIPGRGFDWHRKV